MDGSPFQAATGKSGDLTKVASDALEAAGFHRLGGACLLMRMPAQPKGAKPFSAWMQVVPRQVVSRAMWPSRLIAMLLFEPLTGDFEDGAAITSTDSV